MLESMSPRSGMVTTGTTDSKRLALRWAEQLNGATIQHEYGQWTTMADPGGNLFCVSDLA